jgi:YD repeat-containing protein
MTLRADIATGETLLDRTDLRLEGALPLVMARQYRSGAPVGIFGAGWRHGLDRSLRIEADRIVYREGSGREVVFAPVGVGMEAQHPEGLTLQHHADGYVVFASPLAQDVFRKGGDVLRLERIVDSNGNRIKLTYAGSRLAEITGSGGQRIRFVYAGGVVGQIVVAGSDGRSQVVRTFRYGAGNTLVAETDAEGRTTEYAYQSGLLVRAGASSGAAWLAQYDGDRRCIALWRADGTAVHHLAYDDRRHTTRAVGTDGQQVLYRTAVGPQGVVVLERIDAAGESLNYYYDEAQRLAGYSEPGGSIAAFQRLDSEKGEQFQLDHERRAATATLGAGGLLKTVKGTGEGDFTFDYDERFNLVGLTTPLGFAWTFERDGKGRATAVVSPAGRRLTLRREGAMLTISDGEGVLHRLTLDLLGRIAAHTDRMGRERRFRYDAEGRLRRVEIGDAYQVQWEYDVAGRLVHVADAERSASRWSRDGAGRVLSLEADGEAVRFAYDLAGRIHTASGTGGDVTFGYDEQDRLRFARGPRWMTFNYDEDRVTVKTKEGQRVFGLDGDLLEEQTQEGSLRQFQHGLSGELRSVEQDGGGETENLLLDYDEDGRLVRIEGRDEGATFSYDADGLLIQVETGDRPIRLDYDARLRPAAIHVGDTAYNLTFDDAVRLTDLQYEGQRCTLRYDALDRCVAYSMGAGEEQRATDTAGQVQVGAGLAVVVARHSVALVAEVGSLALPLWGHDEVRLRALPLDARIVRAVVLGSTFALAPMPSVPGPPVERWAQLASADGLETGVPSAATLGMPWPTLDFFALARDRYDPHFARRIPGALPSHQPDMARAPDDVLTGSHRTGVLHGSVWAERAHGPHLDQSPLAPPGGVPADLAFYLYRTLTRS